MRIILAKGKQTELILESKKNKTWNDLAKLLCCSSHYLSNELKSERRYISDIIYYKLCKISGMNFDEFIIERLDDNWGRSKGGKHTGNLQRNVDTFNKPLESSKLAELLGIILGDGHIEKIVIGNKIRCYSIVITGDSRFDRDYLENYVNSLFKELFGKTGKLRFSKNNNSLYLKIHGKKIVEFLEEKGLLSGNKKNNNQAIPRWILNNDSYLKDCLRGLIDTDGCVYYISKSNKNLRISYTSYIPNLMKDVRDSFIKLGYNPSKVIRDKDISISRISDIDKFMKEIGFSNNKHLKRFQNLTNHAPIV